MKSKKSKIKRCGSCEISFKEFAGDPNPLKGIPLSCEYCHKDVCENCTIVLTLDRERFENYGDFIYDGSRHHVISDAMRPYIFEKFPEYKKTLETTLPEIEKWHEEHENDEDILTKDPPSCVVYICKKCYTSWEMDFLKKLKMNCEHVRKYLDNNWYSLEAKQAYEALLTHLQ